MTITAKVNGSLSARLRAAGEQLQARCVANVHAFGTAVLADLIEQTPKLSGQATANWQVSLGESNDVFIQLEGHRAEYHSADVSEALEFGTEVIESFELGATLVIFNNAPYITLLNEGYSPKAPAGFVQAIIDNHRHLLGDISLEF